MGLGRTPKKSAPESSGNNLGNDGDATEEAPEANQTGNLAAGGTDLGAGQSTGTMPKLTANSPLNFDFTIPPPPKSQSKMKNTQYYTSLIKGLIEEANKEYRADMEGMVDKRIQLGFKAGFEQMYREIQKLTISKDNLDQNENLSDKERETRSTAKGSKERERFVQNSSRRLDFEDFVPIRHNNNSEDEELTRFSNGANQPDNPPRSTLNWNRREEDTSRPIYPNNRRNHDSFDFRENYCEPVKGRIFVDKWDLVFDGNSENLYVEDFISRVEYLQEYYGCQWKEIMRDFHRLLKGDVKDWYWDMVTSGKIRNWRDLKEALVQQYKTNRSEYEFMRDLEERRQKSGETIDSYFQAMRKLRARLRKPLPEYEMIRIVKRNLKREISQIVYPLHVYTIEHLRDECKEVEKNYFRRDSTTSATTARFVPQKRVVHEVFESQDEVDNEFIDEIKHPIRNSKPSENKNKTVGLTCWNCGKSDHFFKNCPLKQRNIFCYKCGMADVITPECPKCTENTRRSVAKIGEPRSNQTSDVL